MGYIVGKTGVRGRTRSVAAALAVTLALSACGTGKTESESGQPYDYYVDCTTREQLAALADEPFVEDIFAFSLMQFVLPDTASGEERRLMLLATESFDNIDTSSFERQTLIAEDSSILKSPDSNPIIIDEALSRDEGLDVGDTLAVPNRLTEEPVVFTVGAIYRRTSLFARYDAVILCNGQTNPAFFAVDDEMGFTAAYVKASNLQGLRDYLENEFVPGLIVKKGEMTQQEIDAIPRGELANYYEDYASHRNRSV